MTRQEVIDHINRRGDEFEALVEAARQHRKSQRTITH
jgi:hypothetical protein